MGQRIFLQHIGADLPNEEETEELARDFEQPESEGSATFAGPTETKAKFVFFERYDQFGIYIRDYGAPEFDVTYFVSWGAVLTIVGPQVREEVGPEPAAQGQTEQVEDEQAEEAASSHDRRQELMDLLANAQTTTEVAVARDAADAWLAANPSDGDVRLALERLPDPTGD